MTDQEQIFRAVLILGLLSVLPVGIYHRLRAHAAGDVLDRRAEGWFILVTLRPLALLRFLAVLAYVIHPPWMAWSAVALPSWVRWCGVAIGVAAAILLTVVFRALGTNLTDTVVTRARHTLVTTGPYRWVRHPFYTAFALAVVADSLVAANWFLALTGALTWSLIAIRSITEERFLLQRFGERYREYRSRTGRFLPRLTRASP